MVSNSIVKQKSVTFLSRQVKISVTRSKEYRQKRENVDTLNHVKGKHLSTSVNMITHTKKMTHS
jgi:predicted patatin/cPLA2 family phospholipase